jgi:hypothetical protein
MVAVKYGPQVEAEFDIFVVDYRPCLEVEIIFSLINAKSRKLNNYNGTLIRFLFDVGT